MVTSDTRLSTIWPGWTTNPALYFRNIEKAEALIGNGLFRPPYGHLRLSAPCVTRYLQKHYQVVFRDVRLPFV